MNLKRVRTLSESRYNDSPVIYWMSRDQRVNDNWALIYAQELALKYNAPLVVAFCLVPEFLGATIRQYKFMLTGLQHVENDLLKKNIPFFLLFGSPENEIPKFITKMKVGALVTDFSPLKINQGWKEKIKLQINIPFYEVDAHNIVPCWIASTKQEFGAYTIRPKIQRLLPEYLDKFPSIKKQKLNWNIPKQQIDWNKITDNLKIDSKVPEVGWLKPGEKAAYKMMEYFFKSKLNNYYVKRNDPNEDAQSNLSPYLHFGQVSAQRIALNIQKYEKYLKSSEAFLEELIIRRELSDNFCFYNSEYDSFEGLPHWAKETLNTHRVDKRDYIYSLKEFEEATTHDSLWNSAQREMVYTGKMHGYMRMYWAKKILDWTKIPEEAVEIAIYLNDKYELDGRDPNGYAGILWSIGGVHDRAWGERRVFGKVRFMNDKGCKRKFNVKKYISENLF
jgi:deoxyribodipyrimidine photo-lyase